MEKLASQSHRHEENDRKTLYQTYTDYIDPSSITVNHYLAKNFYPGQECHIDKINEWIQADSQPNKPLVFKTSPGVGVKTILSRWFQQTLEQNACKKYKTLPIIHFASNGGNNSNYFYCLYRIVIKLREALKIRQRVDLLEQKIRKYFAYWLDTCSSEIQKQQVVLSTNDIYEKIVIVIEGVDKFIDSQTGKQANIAFWLPQTFPKNVRVICTVGGQSESLQYFQKKECPIESIYTSTEVINQLLEAALAKSTIFNQDMETKLKRILEHIAEETRCSSSIYKIIQIYSQFLLVEATSCKKKDTINTIKQIVSTKADLTQLQQITTADSLYDFILNMYSDSLPFKKKISEILMYFALSQKGITIKQIIQLTRFTEQEWGLFTTIFAPVLIKHDSIYSIKCMSFVESVIRKDRSAKENKEMHLIKYHQKIAEALQNTPNSIRKLEQETYHLFVSKSYFKLKEIVSSIQNFLLMFNPSNKYELSRYWQKLQEKGFDPVIEYNKAIEGFSMHYHPSDENIFKIIVQISRFLKQFCDFQTYETPAFRHPLIEGNMAELQTIGLLGEFTELEIYVDNSFNQAQDPKAIVSCSFQQQIQQIRQKHFPKDKSEQEHIEAGEVQKLNQETVVKSIENYSMDILERINKKIKKKADTKILTPVEKLNVDVPMNREKFRNYYLESLQEYMKDEDYKQGKEKQGYFEVQDDNLVSDCKKINRQKAEFSVNKIKQNYKMRYIKPSLYYYKRWIWIQFPWVCISLNNNYSNTPEFCGQVECEDADSYEQEAKYTKQALIVAIEAKEKKKMMFTKKSDEFNGFGTGFGSRLRNTNLTTNRFSASRNVDKSSIRSKVLQKSSSNIDLNLNTLSRELELRKKNLPAELIKESHVKEGNFFLSAINQKQNQNCKQDMKFIEERKHFEAPDTAGLPSNEILPRLKWTIKDHTNYQISYIKAHIQQKKKKLNKIIFENKKLAETYRELKVKEGLTKKNMHEQQSDKHSRKAKLLEQYAQKKEDVINEFCKSLLQEERLNIILKLCAENKTRNEEYLASLNYFLQNLKKMITWEKNNIKEVTTEMSGIKAMKQKKLQMEAEKEKNDRIVRNEAKNYIEEKEKLEQQIQNISVIIADDLKDQKDKLENSLEGHLKNREEKNMLMIQEKKTKQLQEKLKSLQQEYQMLKQLFEIDGTDFESSPKFQRLLDENEKNKKLKIIYFERKNKLEEAQKDYQRAKQQYEKVKNQKKLESNVKQNTKVKSFKDQLHGKQNQVQTKNMNNLKILLSNIALKLGVKSTQEIVPFLKVKLGDLQQSNPAKYHEIMSRAPEQKQHLIRG